MLFIIMCLHQSTYYFDKFQAMRTKMHRLGPGILYKLMIWYACTVRI